MNHAERFPIMGDAEIKWVPWRMMTACETQALTNHYQTLSQLASRGGLSVTEALAVIEGRRWRDMDADVARAELKSWVEAHIATAT